METKQVITKRVVSSSGQPSQRKAKKNSKKAKKPKISKEITIRNVAPVATSKVIISREPKQTAIRNGVRLVGSELVGNVAKPAGGNTSSLSAIYPIFRLRCNPGSAKVFPWASRIAANYEYYKFHKLVFRYETRTSTSNTGSIIISPDYDAADGDSATNEQFLYMNKGTTNDVVWKHQECHLRPESMNRLYKSHAVMSDERFETSGQDEKTIDCAQVFVCVESADYANPQFYGKLFVDYIVDCTEPQNPTEPVNMGGARLSTGALVANSAKPIAAVTTIQGLVSDPGVLQPLARLQNVTFPTATVGRFIKDYEGVLTMRQTGTGLQNNCQFYIGSDPNAEAGASTDTVQALSSAFSGLSDASFLNRVQANKIIAKAGEYLRVRTPSFNDITFSESNLAGVLRNNIL